ncbi:hypothetical protein SAMN04488038_102190 [Solimonas aquatica]|uniref:Thioredoxin domain-containing protein n=1 Tax=Solimonas aquatica TaxID=489703 RepID=A0A1H9BST8_9GAMM|nr:SCO family protein [Solimonas aquatica]SEP91428.1 hypothetical protein SAMN04488038_102190 [Solimonas aquatica]
MNQVPRGRAQLLLLALLFFGPMLAASLLYFVFPQWQPQGRVNYGELIHPARPLPALQLLDAQGRVLDTQQAFGGRWTWLYLGAAQCERACLDKLYQIRQVRALLNEKRQRAQRVYLAPDAGSLAALRERLAAEHPDLKLYAEQGAAQLPAFLAQDAGKAAGAQTLYLIDPHGNWLMVYPDAADSTGLLKDIKKLLSLSQIG